MTTSPHSHEDGFFREMVEGAECALLRCDAQQRVAWLNPHGRRLLGVGADAEVAGKNAVELIGVDPQERSRFGLALRQAAGAPQRRIELETRRDTTAGPAVHLRWSLRGIEGCADVVAIGHDVTSDHELAASLAESERTFDEVMKHLRQCVWIKDRTTPETGRMTFASPAFEQLFGVPVAWFHGQPDRLYELIHPEDVQKFREAVEAQFERSYDVEYRVVRPDGSICWLWSRAEPIRNEVGRIERLVGITEDITPRKEAEERIRRLNVRLEGMYRREQELSRTDGLTGLGNRQRYEEEAAKLWERALREAEKADEPRHVALILIDVDRFKEVNDTLGHPTGDACLRAVAAGIRASVRQIDVATRLGGDEFAVLLPNTTLTEAELVARRIWDSVAASRVAAHKTETPIGGAKLTVSVGVAAADAGHAGTIDTLYREADRALYRAKRAGRGTVVTASG